MANACTFRTRPVPRLSPQTKNKIDLQQTEQKRKKISHMSRFSRQRFDVCFKWSLKGKKTNFFIYFLFPFFDNFFCDATRGV